MKLPTKWSEVSLKKYIQITELSEIDMDELDRHAKVLSILSGESEDKILSMSVTALKQCITATTFIYTLPEGGAIKQFIKLSGKRFKVNTKLNTISAGEYIDLSNYTKDKETVNQNLHNILAIFFVPVNVFGNKRNKYYQDGVLKLEQRNKNAEIIKENIMMSDVFSLSGFFLKLYESLMEATVNYSMLKAKEANRKLKQQMDSLGIGAGS